MLRELYRSMRMIYFNVNLNVLRMFDQIAVVVIIHFIKVHCTCDFALIK